LAPEHLSIGSSESEASGAGYRFPGYNILPYLEGQVAATPRHDFFYFDDDGQLVAMRHDNWKFVFCERRAPGNLNIWMEPFICLRLPKIYNLRMDPYERADITSDQYNDWLTKNVYLNVQGTIHAEEFMETFKEYPPSRRLQALRSILRQF
jgi:arylsulfatase A-like enzyme